jgi:hypothetical protein
MTQNLHKQVGHCDASVADRHNRNGHRSKWGASPSQDASLLPYEQESEVACKKEHYSEQENLELAFHLERN